MRAHGYDWARRQDTAALRQAIRHGRYRRHTAGLADGKMQCNLVILPSAHAVDFAGFCRLNPAPCPVIALSRPGIPSLPALGAEIDLRTDAPRYRVYRDGVPVADPTDIIGLWRDDLVAFAIGCSFTFERALMVAGIRLRHIDEDKTVPMYRTRIACTPAGPFAGEMVVSMRPIPHDAVDRARAISARYPHAHGAPLHAGDPSAIGIEDLSRPDWGDPVTIRPGETPVFWACGVTPQNALTRARLPLCITHAPGHMLITDLDEVGPRADPSIDPFVNRENQA